MHLSRLHVPCLVLGSTLLLALPPRCTAAEPASPPSTQNLTPDQALARGIFQELIEINSTHQFGSTRAAQAMAARLLAAGFPSTGVQVLEPRPGKGNLVARWRGTGQGKPILFLAHLDVVEARKEDWTYDPFQFTEHDGYFYGRGTSDVKDEDADLVANFVRLRRQGFTPNRDFILALTADEEGGGDANGVEWLLKEHRALLDAAFCINTDAGGGQIKNGRRLANTVQTSEKIYLSLRLEVHNKGGHSSLPVKDNAIYHLAAALNRLAQFEFPIHLTQTVRTYFSRMGELETGPLSAAMKAVAADSPDLAAATRLCQALPYYNALLRTTAVATEINGGHAENALPQSATAIVNCRILPDQSPDRVQQILVRLIDDPQIKVSRVEEPHLSPPSPLDPAVLSPVERITGQMWPGVVVVPEMSTGATDGLFLRQAGIPVYGVSGMFFDVDDVRAHGKDERITVQSFYDGFEFMARLMRALGSD